MGFRLQRSIRIAKGVRLNISKSGLGVSVGPRGAKLSVGPRGAYSHLGIPGTGLSVRSKIASNSPTEKTSRTSNNPDSTEAAAERTITVDISIDDENGNEDIRISEHGREVRDESILRRIRRDPGFKEKLRRAREKTHAGIKEKTEVLTQIHTWSEPLPDWEKIAEQIETTEPERWERQSFTEPKPDKEGIRSELQQEADRLVKGLFGRRKKRRLYVEQRVEKSWSDALTRWEGRKSSFERIQDELETSENGKLLQELTDWKHEMNRMFAPDAAYLEDRLEDLFSAIQLPVDFSISYEIRKHGELLYLDVDLPEIEDYPAKKSQILKSGKVSIKDKTGKDKKLDYLRSVTGISVYFASIAFSASPVIREIAVSGYSQRLNKASGNIENEYLYSVKYDKDKFSTLNFEHIEPELTLQAFEHRIDITGTFDMRPIIPF